MKKGKTKTVPAYSSLPYTEKNFSSQEELLEYVKEVGGTIVSGKDLESMFPPSSEVMEIDIIEEPKDLKTVLLSCDTVSQHLEELLEEKQKQIDAAFAEYEDEEIDLQQLEMVINLLLKHVKSWRCLLYLENLGAEVITIRAYKARNRCESILGVLHNSPHSREHYVNVAEFIEKRSETDHDEQCAGLVNEELRDHYSRLYGINQISILSSLMYFHVIGGLVPDIMHDILEGVRRPATYFE
ncbi:hypothetical protein OUZ56_011025 [Daphnia magna]|uniref:BRCT domain-containing protein n=1 Tax=Daphnia magna TaxID=35525 RepID=A0ABQ9YZ86_9CRUS|nr:hypothetical protein OUZ56_011025 [Daphnia magna]